MNSPASWRRCVPAQFHDRALIVRRRRGRRVITLRRPETEALTQTCIARCADASTRRLEQSGPPLHHHHLRLGVFTAATISRILEGGTSSHMRPRAANAAKFLYSLRWRTTQADHRRRPMASQSALAPMLFHCDYVLASKTGERSRLRSSISAVPEAASACLMRARTWCTSAPSPCW